jgi:hypothetical protein
MRPPSIDLDAWIRFARRRRLEAWAAFLLDSFDPLAPLAAQLLYLLEPLTGRTSAVRRTARALEDGAERRAVARRLAEESRE